MNEHKTSSLARTDLVLGSMLVEGEKLILRGRVHWAIFWQGAAVLISALVLCAYVQELGILLGVVGVLMVLHALITRYFLLLALTNKRVLARYGLLQMEVVDMRFSKIESLELERMLPGLILGYANVVVAGVGQRTLRIPYIANATEFRQAYNTLALEQENKT